MSFITWTPEQFGTNVGIHDQEHQAIFQGLNALHAAAGSGDRAATGSQLDSLIGTVKSHFASEEANLIKCGFAGFDAHKAEHDKLLATCSDLQQRFQAGQAEVTAETTGFIKDWLGGHIPTIDRSYAEPMKSAGIN